MPVRSKNKTSAHFFATEFVQQVEKGTKKLLSRKGANDLEVPHYPEVGFLIFA